MGILGRRLYEYQFYKTKQQPLRFSNTEIEWPFPYKYYSSISFTVNGFSFEFSNAENDIRQVLNPRDGLVNVENVLKQVTNTLTN